MATNHQQDSNRESGDAEFEILFTDIIFTETNSFKKRYLT